MASDHSGLALGFNKPTISLVPAQLPCWQHCSSNSPQNFSQIMPDALVPLLFPNYASIFPQPLIRGEITRFDAPKLKMWVDRINASKYVQAPSSIQGNSLRVIWNI